MSGFKVELGEASSTLTFDEAMDAIETFADRRVLVSMADLDANACGSIFGVLKRRLDAPADSEVGPLSVFDIGVNGLLIVSQAAYVGASWCRDEDDEWLALQNGGVVLTIRDKPRRPEDEEA